MNQRLRSMIVMLVSILAGITVATPVSAQEISAFLDMSNASLGMGGDLVLGEEALRLNFLVDAYATIAERRPIRLQHELDLQALVGLGVYPKNLRWWFQINGGLGGQVDLDRDTVHLTPRVLVIVGQTLPIGFYGSVATIFDPETVEVMIQLRPGVAARWGRFLFIGSLIGHYDSSEDTVDVGAGFMTRVAF